MDQEAAAAAAATTDNNVDNDDEVSVLEQAYRDALALFKADKTNKDLRRARTAAKKAWDEAVIRNSKDTGAKQLRCRDCSQMFLWTTEDQEYYKAAERCWNHEPQRCNGCAEMQKFRRRSNNETNDTGGGGKEGKNMCYAFQRGACPYGDNCKFNHDPEFAGKPKEDEPQPGSSSSTNNGSDSSALESGVKCKVVPETIAVCKWGKDCTLKRCRYRHDDDVNGASPVLTTNRNDSRDETKTGAGSKRTATTTPAPSSKKPKTVLGICKWGKNCTLKRCRFKHEDNTVDSSAPSSQPLPFGNEQATYCMKAGKSASASTSDLHQTAAPSVSSAKDDEQKKSKTKSKKNIDKLVHKAMAKALKKAPKKELRVKELRKLVRKKMESLGKDEIKVVVRKAIAENKDSMALLEDGTVVKLLAS